MAKSTLVPKIVKNAGGSSTMCTKQPEDYDKNGPQTRAYEKQTFEAASLASIRKGKLRKSQWSNGAIDRMMKNWAPSTLKTYEVQANKYLKYCALRGYKPESVPSHVVADYLCDIAASSKKPTSILRTVSAALGNLYSALESQSPIDDDVGKLINGLVKSETTLPMMKSIVMSREPFMKMFTQWPDNVELSVAIEDENNCATFTCNDAATIRHSTQRRDVRKRPSGRYAILH